VVEPSLSNIRLTLTENEKRTGVKGGCVSWLGLGISLEDAQYAIHSFSQYDLTDTNSRDKLRWESRQLSKHASVADKTKLAERRQRLGRRIHAFHSKAATIMGDIDVDDLHLKDADIEAADEIHDSNGEDSDGEEGDKPEDDLDWDNNTEASDDGLEVLDYPEKCPLILPSSLGLEGITLNNLKVLASQELQLRQGQANDSLEGLRLALGHKALLFRTRVRQAGSNKERTRAWDDVKTARRQVEKHVRGYHRARKAMEKLGADKTIMSRYKMIVLSDLKLSGDITQENRLGQRNDTLPWFWTMHLPSNQNNAWINECKLSIQFSWHCPT